MTFGKSIEDTCQLISEEDRNNSRRCFMSAETMIVSRRCCRYPEQILILINSFYDSNEEKEELRIVLRVISGLQKIRIFSR